MLISILTHSPLHRWHFATTQCSLGTGCSCRQCYCRSCVCVLLLNDVFLSFSISFPLRYALSHVSLFFGILRWFPHRSSDFIYYSIYSMLPVWMPLLLSASHCIKWVKSFFRIQPLLQNNRYKSNVENKALITSSNEISTKKKKSDNTHTRTCKYVTLEYVLIAWHFLMQPFLLLNS